MLKDLKNDLQELQKFASTYHLREDWHEPGEQDVSATVVGELLDNAFGNHIDTEAIEGGYQEIVVVLKQEGGDSLKVNLASLLALACAAKIP